MRAAGWASLALFAILASGKTGAGESASEPISFPAPAVAPGDHPQGVLIDHGQAHATIVVPANPGPVEQYAAADLQRVFCEMTGVSLPIAEDAQTLHGNRILIGQTRFTDRVVAPAERQSLEREAFIVRQRGRDLALVGGGSWGAMYACAELYDRLGARWYMPGELGACVPRLETIRFDGLEARQAPSFAMRWVGKDVEWSLRNRSNRVEEDDLPPGFCVYPGIYHTQSRYISHAEFGRTHPEYSAQIKGKRSQGPEAKLCNSNPELPKVIAEKMGRMLRERPGIDLISLSPTDRQLWCECEACKQLDEAGVSNDRKYSRRQMILYNRVAAELEKEFPEQGMLVGAYNVYTWPPKDGALRAHRNLAVVICHYETYCLAHAVNDPACPKNQRYLELIRAWQEQTPRIYFYEYYDKANWIDLPWPIVHTVARDIPFFQSIGVKGLYTQWSEPGIWSTFLGHYVAARLLWNSTADVGALLDEFYEKFYGEAAMPMRRWHEALEKQAPDCGEHFPGNAPRYAHCVFTEPVVEQLQACVKEAQGLAKSDLVKRRVDKMAALTEYTARMARYFQLRQQAETLRGAERRAAVDEALQTVQAALDDIRRNRDRYSGVTTGGMFAGGQLMGREIEKLRAMLAEN